MNHDYFVKFSVFNDNLHTYQGALRIDFNENDSCNFTFSKILHECAKLYTIGTNNDCTIDDITIQVLTRIN